MDSHKDGAIYDFVSTLLCLVVKNIPLQEELFCSTYESSLNENSQNPLCL
mgnify:CR=1 FL=1